jgi:lipopolysaccharide export system protein LptC
MAIEANIAAGAGGYLIRTPEQRDRAFASAERHTRLVRFLRKTLPVLAVLVLAAYFVTSKLGMSINVGDLTASIDGIEVADGNLRMTNPKLEGTDKKNGTYLIGADYADQDVKNPNIIKLHAIRAELSSADGGWSRMRAVRGVFNSKGERLVMQDKITVATSSGITGELKHASLDTKTQTLRSHRPVVFDLPNGSVRAGALTFRSSDSTLTFRGKVRVHVVREEKQAKPDEQAKPDKPKVEQDGPLALPPLPEAQAAPPDTSALPVVPPPLPEAAVTPQDTGAMPMAVPPLPDVRAAPRDTSALPVEGQ